MSARPVSNWKRQANTVLRRLTGYRVVRARSARPGPAGTSGARSGAGGDGDPAATTPKAATPARRAPRAGGAAGKATFPADYDEDARRTIRSVRPYTMTHDEKLFALILATRYVTAHGIPGDVVECGVWRGGSMQAVARTLLADDDTSRELYLFDTFEGMPPPTDRDVRHDGVSAEDLLATNTRDARIWAVATLDEVQDAFSHVPYPTDRVHFVQGLVEDTVPREAPEQISILRLDTDWYESTRHELEQLYPRLSPGGVLIIDDYGWFDGSRQAVDEYLERTGERLLLLRTASGRIAVKP